MRIKLTPEELKERQRISQQRYRDKMSPEQKAKQTESKRLSAIKCNDRRVAERKTYYEKNKEVMNAKSRAYQQSKRDIAKALGYKNLIALPRPKKVINQPATMTTLKEEASKMGIATAHLRAMQRNPNFHMPEYTLLRSDGMELFDTFEMLMWQQTYREMIAQETISCSTRNTAGIVLDKRVLLVINWLQETKHVTDYCNKQRVAINSNKFWSRYG